MNEEQQDQAEEPAEEGEFHPSTPEAAPPGTIRGADGSSANYDPDVEPEEEEGVEDGDEEGEEEEEYDPRGGEEEREGEDYDPAPTPE